MLINYHLNLRNDSKIKRYLRKSKQFLVYKNSAISYNQTGEKHMTLAEKLTQARKAAGLTQAQMSLSLTS